MSEVQVSRGGCRRTAASNRVPPPAHPCPRQYARATHLEKDHWGPPGKQHDEAIQKMVAEVRRDLEPHLISNMDSKVSW